MTEVKQERALTRWEHVTKQMGEKLNIGGPIEAVGKVLRQALGSPDDETFFAALVLANEHGLNPLLKEIYVFKGKSGAGQPIVGHDGWVKIAQRHPNYEGHEYEDRFSEAGELVSVTCKIHVKGRKVPLAVTEYLSENKMNTPVWGQRPLRMLRHRAYAQAVREAFGVSGVYHDLEPEEVRGVVDIDAKVTGPQKSRTNEIIDQVTGEIFDGDGKREEPAAQAEQEQSGDGEGGAEPVSVPEDEDHGYMSAYDKSKKKK